MHLWMCLTQTTPHTLLVKTHTHLNREVPVLLLGTPGQLSSLSFTTLFSQAPFSYLLLFSLFSLSILHRPTHCCPQGSLLLQRHLQPPMTALPSRLHPGQLLLSLALLVSSRQPDSHPWRLPAPERPGQ